MDQVLTALASQADTTAVFGRVAAEESPALTEKFGVSVVPTFVLLSESGSIVERVEGGEDVAKVTQAVQRLMQQQEYSGSASQPVATSEAAGSNDKTLAERLECLIRSSEVMLFMKGMPGGPRCGFSRQAVELLQADHIPFGSFDILTDEDVRQGLKKHSDWPTYPQVYVKGELIGGLDILQEMSQEQGGLKTQLGVSADENSSPPSLEDRLKSLIRRQRVMLFMKGLPSAPRCGFSRQMVEILDNEEDVAYDTFDILQDEEVRQGLKTFSDWPTYPQLYVDGELIGGLDIVKEMQADGSLRSTLQGS